MKASPPSRKRNLREAGRKARSINRSHGAMRQAWLVGEHSVTEKTHRKMRKGKPESTGRCRHRNTRENTGRSSQEEQDTSRQRPTCPKKKDQAKQGARSGKERETTKRVGRTKQENL